VRSGKVLKVLIDTASNKTYALMKDINSVIVGMITSFFSALASINIFIDRASPVISCVVFTTIATSGLFAGKVSDSCRSPKATQKEGRVHYVLVWPYSWQLEHCTGLLRLCGSSTVI